MKAMTIIQSVRDAVSLAQAGPEAPSGTIATGHWAAPGHPSPGAPTLVDDWRGVLIAAAHHGSTAPRQVSPAFDIVLLVAGTIIAVALLASLVLILACRHDTNRAVVADAVFYPMIALYVLWALQSDASIVYEIIVLTSLLGVLSTVSLARIITRGGR